MSLNHQIIVTIHSLLLIMQTKKRIPKAAINSHKEVSKITNQLTDMHTVLYKLALHVKVEDHSIYHCLGSIWGLLKLICKLNVNYTKGWIILHTLREK